MSDAPLALLSRRLTERFAAEDFAAGFALGRHILRAYPRMLSVYQRMGLAAQGLGLFADSVDLLQRALSADPEDARAWRGLHLAALALDLHPDADIAQTYFQDLAPPAAPETAIARGHEAARARDWPAAYRAFRQGLESHPDRMDAALGLAEALFHLQQPEAVQTIARYILQELPYALKAHLLILLAARELGQPQESQRRHLRAVQALDPLGEVAGQWLPASVLTPFLPNQPTLPAWDENERWAYAL